MRYGKVFQIILFIILWFLPYQQVEAAPPPEKVSIQLKWFHQFQFAGYYAAFEKGFYAEEGLDVELIEYNPSVSHVDQVLNGKSEYGIADAGILRIRQQGKPVTVLAQIFQYSPLVYITLPDSGLRTPYDLLGRKVMTAAIGDSDAPLNAMIVRALGGLDKVEFKAHTYRNEDLLEGKMDAMLAYSSNEPFWFKERGINVNIIDPRDYGIDFYGDNLFTTDYEIRNHPQRTAKVVRASLKGWKYALEHRDEIIDLIIEKYNTQKRTREHLAFEANQVEMLVNPRFVEIGHFEPTRYQKIAGIYTSLGLSKEFMVDEQFYFKQAMPPVDLTSEEVIWLEAHPKIRLGIDPSYPPFEFIGKSGDYVGIAVDYLALINERLGTDMSIVSGLSWKEVMDRAKKREIDALPTLGKTEERSTYLNFTRPYMSFPVVFLTRKDQEPISGFNDLAGRKLAMVRGYFYVEEIRREYPDIEPYFVETPIEALKALSNGVVDASLANFAVANHLILKHDIGTIRVDSETDLIGSEFGYAVRKDWPELVSILDKTLSSISEKKHNEIRNRWIAYHYEKQPETGKVELTAEEIAWIKAHPLIKVSNMVNYTPISYVDNNDKAAGFAVDYIKLVAKKTGLDLEFTSDSFASLLQMVKDRKIDILSMANKTKERESFLTFPNPFLLNNPMVIFGPHGSSKINSTDQASGKKIAINKGWAQAKYIRKHYPEIEVIEVKNMAEGFQVVASKLADGYLTRLITGNHFIKQNLIIEIEPIGGFKGITILEGSDVYFAVRKDWSILASIINKGMAEITQKEFNNILSKWGQPTRDRSFKEIAFTPEESAWLQANPRIRVHNEMDWPPFNFNKDGKPKGLSIDFMDLLASKVGVEVEYVSGPSWNEFLGMMESGNLDVMLNIVKTPERQKYLIYTPSYVDNPNTILSRKEASYQTIEQLYGKTVSVPKGFFYEEVLKRDYPQIKILAVKNTLESMKEVSFGKADAAFGEFAVFDHLLKEHMMTGLVVSGEVGMGDPELSLLNIATRKDLPILASILRKGMAIITREDQRGIKNAWITTGEKEDSLSSLGLTDAEENWLKEHPTIAIVDDFAWPPFIFQDDNGEFAGIASSYSEFLSKKLGINFEPQFGHNWEQALEGIKSNKFDAMPVLIRTPEREAYMAFTKPYISFPIVIATRRDSPFIDSLVDLAGKRVGVVKGYATQKKLSIRFPSLKVIPLANVAKGVEALADGKVDAFAGNLGVITHEMYRLGIDTIKIAAPTPFIDQLSFGVRKDWPELVSIIDKTLAVMTDREKAAIKNIWMGITVQFGTQISTILKWVIPGFLLVLGFITFVVTWNRRLGREVTERKLAEEELEKSTSQLQNIFDTSPIGVAVSAKGIIHFTNPRFTEMFDVKIGDPSPDLYVDSEERDVLLERLSKEGKVEKFELQLYGRNRQVREMLLTLLPIDYYGEEGILGWFRDITERKQMVTEMEQNLEDLEKFSSNVVGREEKMIALKEEINQLLEQAGHGKKYTIVE